MTVRDVALVDNVGGTATLLGPTQVGDGPIV